MKVLKNPWVLISIFLIYAVLTSFKYELKSWQITRKLKNDVAIVEGELVSHEQVYTHRGRHRAISVVKFHVGEMHYYATTDRIKVPVGAKFNVKYNSLDPKWHRVIVPDSLLKFKIPAAFFGEERYYTWPPTEPDDIHVMKDNGYNEGPY